MNTGFTELDKLISGFLLGELIILGGRPGMGKTSFAIEVAKRCAPSVLYISLDPHSELLHRKAIGSHGFHIVECYNMIIESVANADEISDCKLPKYQCFFEISNLRELIAPYKDEVDLIIVDYIQLFKTKGQAKELKELAIETNKTILALSRLSRACEIRENHRPKTSDLSLSLDAKKYADKILLMYREACYNYKASSNIVEIIVYSSFKQRPQSILLAYEQGYLDETYFRQLPRRFCDFDFDELENAVASLGDNHDQHPQKYGITREYAYRLMNLTQRRFAGSNSNSWMESFSRLESIAAGLPYNKEYARIIKHALNVDYTPERLAKMLNQCVNNVRMAEAIAGGLAFLSPQTSGIMPLMKIRRRLERLNAEYPNNTMIASAYAEGIFYLAAELRWRGSGTSRTYIEALETLVALAEKYPGEESISGWAKYSSQWENWEN